MAVPPAWLFSVSSSAAFCWSSVSVELLYFCCSCNIGLFEKSGLWMTLKLRKVKRECKIGCGTNDHRYHSGLNAFTSIMRPSNKTNWNNPARSVQSTGVTGRRNDSFRIRNARMSSLQTQHSIKPPDWSALFAWWSVTQNQRVSPKCCGCGKVGVIRMHCTRGTAHFRWKQAEKAAAESGIPVQTINGGIVFETFSPVRPKTIRVKYVKFRSGKKMFPKSQPETILPNVARNSKRFPARTGQSKAAWCRETGWP